MAASDDIKNKAQELLGKGKEATGKATGNDKLEAEGQVDQGKAGVKQAGAELKDKLTGRD